jgi:hypothetical protein
MRTSPQPGNADILPTHAASVASIFPWERGRPARYSPVSLMHARQPLRRDTARASRYGMHPDPLRAAFGLRSLPARAGEGWNGGVFRTWTPLPRLRWRGWGRG